MSAKKANDQDIIKAIVKTRGRVKNAAAMLGMSHGAVSTRLKKPSIQKTLAEIKAEALKASKLSLTKAYKRVNEALDAKTLKKPDHDIRLKAAKVTHEIYQPPGSGQVGLPPQIVVMPVVVIDGKPLQFKVGNAA